MRSDWEKMLPDIQSAQFCLSDFPLNCRLQLRGLMEVPGAPRPGGLAGPLAACGPLGLLFTAAPKSTLTAVTLDGACKQHSKFLRSCHWVTSSVTATTAVR